eukprot:scaffold48813_cov13-Tisochrysis_lutea.AAC.1
MQINAHEGCNVTAGSDRGKVHVKVTTSLCKLAWCPQQRQSLTQCAAVRHASVAVVLGNVT